VTRQFGGLGLGLAITRALVDGHGGRLSAASEGRGRGATFALTLPTVAAPAQVAPEPRDQRAAALASRIGQSCADSPHLRILLVDDHEDTSRAMKRLLERIGYDVKTASTVAGALEVAEAGAFDVLISDIGLPDGSGLDLVRQLKERIERGEPLKAIALSGFGMEEDLQKSREAGFMEHLTKPVSFQQLETAIQQLTGR
jgi:two-component system CheB/CheR fusion protein